MTFWLRHLILHGSSIKNGAYARRLEVFTHKVQRQRETKLHKNCVIRRKKRGAQGLSTHPKQISQISKNERIKIFVTH